jgi:hypothetical protein
MPRPPELPARASRAQRVQWIRDALGSLAPDLAATTDAEVRAYYRYLVWLPSDDRRFAGSREADPLCLRCRRPVHREVHLHCLCGVDQAALDPDDLRRGPPDDD